MKTYKNLILSAITIFSLALLFTPDMAKAQQSGIKRTELQRHDLSIPGREAIQVRIDFEKGASFGKHSHPGEEIIYVLEGIFEYEVEGQPSVTLKAGDVLFIPTGKIHAAKNIGNSKAVELATYIVEKGKPVLKMQK
ncbi:cupin domain-containing protein [Pedobacter hiemivivus]|uniref:Cupin domain-containing protein n=1 Tax=Pedobacter hiemivivus TaxID=2530454 RepID=A0A4U1G8C3_9SPHI|nr:cupin domain-containing protein [Pedobacter hiemivivus]TKC59109.1 cupin domain-containing protein [Pedobacter hiemivivus]